MGKKPGTIAGILLVIGMLLALMFGSVFLTVKKDLKTNILKPQPAMQMSGTISHQSTNLKRTSDDVIQQVDSNVQSFQSDLVTELVAKSLYPTGVPDHMDKDSNAKVQAEINHYLNYLPPIQAHQLADMIGTNTNSRLGKTLKNQDFKSKDVQRGIKYAQKYRDNLLNHGGHLN